MKTHLIQMPVIPGQPRLNLATIQAAIDRSKQAGAELIVFPEMAVPGYLIGDAWERAAFLRECEACGEQVREASRGMTIIFGNVAMDWNRRNEDGRVRKYNALFVAEDGRWLGPAGGPYPFIVKTLLPNYREFDDSRYFYDLRRLAQEKGLAPEKLLAPVASRLGVLGCILCEDAWDMDYALSPLKILGRQDVDYIVNISCSPFTLNKARKRNQVFAAQAAALGRPLIYVNNVGLQNNGKTVYTFDGGTCIYDGAGNQLSLNQPFAAGELVCDLPRNPAATFGAPVSLRADGLEEIHRALEYGTREFMRQCGVSRVVVGVSGGIDSAVVAALYRRILEPDRLLLVNLPHRFNSPTTITLARQLARNLDAYYAEIPIGDSVKLTQTQIDGLEIAAADGRRRARLRLNDLMLENIQARDRSTRVLAAVAAAFDGVFTCNANKAEATVGYTTLYGDLAGYLANLADLWKGEVYRLGRYLNEQIFRREIIPAGCFTLTPSAELSPAQDVDQGRGDPLIYPYHDRLFASWVEWWQRATPEEILAWYAEGTLEKQLGYEGRLADLFPTARAFVADLERWWNQYQGLGVAKRIQAPPVLAVKKRAFGFDHREAQMAPWYSRRYQELKAKLLASALPEAP